MEYVIYFEEIHVLPTDKDAKRRDIVTETELQIKFFCPPSARDFQ